MENGDNFGHKNSLNLFSLSLGPFEYDIPKGRERERRSRQKLLQSAKDKPPRSKSAGHDTKRPSGSNLLGVGDAVRSLDEEEELEMLRHPHV